MTLNIDLTDVAAHAVFNNELTGIRRVQIEYARAVTASSGPDSCLFQCRERVSRSSIALPGKRQDDVRHLRRHPEHVSISLLPAVSAAAEAKTRGERWSGRKGPGIPPWPRAQA
jgi:hypothetical protein